MNIVRRGTLSEMNGYSQGDRCVKKTTVGFIVAGVIAGIAIIAHIMKKSFEKTIYTVEIIKPVKQRKLNFYEKYIKRGLDVVCAVIAIIVFSPLYLGIALAVKLKMGSPILFIQKRPGKIGIDGRETIFRMYKFRSMSELRDEKGVLLPDEIRLGKFGNWLRKTSLDELPEAFNILNGTMSVIGPRPQLVRDMVFMTDEQRMRHTAKPGLSGLAQVNGRNAISWKNKLEWDLKYIENVSFLGDIKIVFQTINKVFVKQEGITQGDMATAEDYGDYLLKMGEVGRNEYDKKQEEAKKILSCAGELNAL